MLCCVSRSRCAGVGLAVLLALLAGPAAALTIGSGPSIQIFADGEQVGSTLSCEIGGGLVCDLKGTATLLDNIDVVRTSRGGDTIILHAGTNMNPDPVLTYTASIIDAGAASTFNFVFSQAIVLTAAPGTATHSFSSNTTNGGSNNGVPVTPAAAPAGIPLDGDSFSEIAKYTLSLNSGGTFVSAGLDLGVAFTQPAGPPASATQGPVSGGGAGPSATGSYDFMRVDVNVSLDGGNDRYGFNGRAEIIPEPDVVPEPGSGALLGLGLIGVALGSRRTAGAEI